MLNPISPPQTVGFESLLGTTVGDYTLCELIGEGGMGVVYAAEQTQPVRRKVALKIIRAGLATKPMLARFQAERQALAMMDHPSIAKVLEVGATTAGQPYLVMELLPGQKITDYANTHGLSTEQRLQVFEKVCHAIQHAHHKGIIHRDLKPSNILVVQIDDEPVPKVIDFGLAKAIDVPLSDATAFSGASRMVGTPMYMSPEQAEMGGTDVDTRSDIYSLGVILYELLTGRLPYDRSTFEHAGFDEKRRMIREVDPCKPSDAITQTYRVDPNVTLAEPYATGPRRLHVQLSGELDWIVLKTLDKDRDRRYGTASELAADVRRYLNHDAVHACPPSALYRLKKQVRRHRVGVGIAAMLATCLLIIGILSTWQVIEVQQARHESEIRARLASDLLEAVRLKSAVMMFSQRNLSALRDELGHWSSSPAESAQAPASLETLLRSAAHPGSVRTFRHQHAIHDVAVSADSQFALTADVAGNVIRWDLAAPNAPPQPLGSHGQRADSVAISPDGERAVSGGLHGTLTFWNLITGQPVKTLQPLSDGVETVCWSPDGKYVAAGARYSEVWVGDRAGNECLRIANDHRHESLLFSPDSSELLIPTRESIDVWNLAAGKRSRSLRTAPLANVRTMCFAGRDRRWLIAGERFSDLLVALDWQTGQQGGQILASEYPRSLAASPDGQWLAAGYTDGRIQLLQIDESVEGTIRGKLHQQFRAHGKAADARLPLQWTDDDHLVSAASDGELHQWCCTDLRPWRTCHPPGALHLALLIPDQPQPRFFYYDHLRNSDAAKQSNDGISFPPGTVSHDPVGNLVAVAHKDVIRITDCQSGEILATVPTPFDACLIASLSSDGSRMIAYDVQQLHVWQSHDHWATFQRIQSLDLPQYNPPTLTDNGQTIIVDAETQDCLIEVDTASGKVRTRYGGPSDAGYCVSHDARLLAEALHQSIRIQDRITGQILFQQAVDSQPCDLRFFPDDRVLLSLHNDGSVCAWHVPTRQFLGTLFAPDFLPGTPFHLQIAADGRRVLMNYDGPSSRTPIVLGHP